MKVYVCYELIDYGDYDHTEIRHVFFYQEDADKWVGEASRYTPREYKEMKIE